MSIAIPAEDPRHLPNRAVVDLGAITHNTRQIAGSLAEQTALMAVVKADAYGHGMLGAARAALAGGATWLGAAHPASALALSRAGIDVPIFTWLYDPRTARELLPAMISASIEISVGSRRMLELVSEAARESDLRARVHLKIDTGMGRGGALPEHVLELGVRTREDENLNLVATWTHLSSADALGEDTTDRQIDIFDSICEDLTEEVGPIALQHVANTAAALSRRGLHRDLVRTGIGLYGYAPVPTDLDLRPAMSLTSRIAMVKEVGAGQSVGYGRIHTAPTATRLGLIPVGYADGLDRAASGAVSVLVRTRAGDQLAPQVGRISMDQIVVDLGPDSAAREEDAVIIFGAPDALDAPAAGAPEITGPRLDPPTAEDWARAAGTIPYEILTSLSVRVPREVRSPAAGDAA